MLAVGGKSPSADYLTFSILFLTLDWRADGAQLGSKYKYGAAEECDTMLGVEQKRRV